MGLAPAVIPDGLQIKGFRAFLAFVLEGWYGIC